VIVTDANIIVYRLITNSRTTEVESLVKFDPEWAVPGLWRSEVRNALASHMRAGHIDSHQAEVMMQIAATSLLGGEHTVSDHAVFDLVTRSRCSAYDCEYVALAEALGVVMVTEDKALLRAFPKRCRSIAQVI
jgi:predicted nucleic acid-binding protein